jgi:hypothetical protein
MTRFVEDLPAASGGRALARIGAGVLAVAIAAAPLQAATVESGYPPPGEVDSASDQQGTGHQGLPEYAPVGSPLTAEEADQRGGNVVIIYAGRAVLAVQSCATNAVCRTVATALIKALGRKGVDYLIEKNNVTLRAKACSIGLRQYC